MNSYTEILQSLAAQHNLRHIPRDTSHTPDLLDFSTNDYLGLGKREDLRNEFLDNDIVRHLPLTSSASRLLASSQNAYNELEGLLSDLYGRPALLFNSGYHANTGLIPALAEGRTLILADKLVHASIIDGMVLSKAAFMRFRHNDTAHLQTLIAKHAADYDRILIVAESVYSMDGDTAPLEELATVRRSLPNAVLYIDEAHALGVLGEKGLGLCQSLPCSKDFDVIVGTFGKACASVGAFCVTSDNILHDFVLNKARSFIFSTALPPFNAAWTTFVLKKIITMDAEREHLARLADLLAVQLPGNHPASHIHPFITGSSEKALQMSSSLLEHDIKVLPIRTPTVPPGTERLRISLSADMTEEDIIRLADTIKMIN